MISIYNPSEVKSTTLPRNILDAIQQGGGGAVIDDETVGTNTTWSSNKINTEIGSVSVDVIDDSVTSTEKTWSSDKIDDVVSEKASINDNATSDSATWSSSKIRTEIDSGSGADVIDDTITSTTKTWSSDKIDDVVSEKAAINDSATGASTTWSSNKISTEIASATESEIDDTTIGSDKTWSSRKIDNVVSEKASINDSSTGASTTWSSSKISTEIAGAGGVEIDDTTTSTTKTWSSSKIATEISQGGGGGAAFDDNIISSTKGWTSARIWDVIQHADMYSKEYTGTFGRVTDAWYTMFTVVLADLYTDLGLKFTYATTDSFHVTGDISKIIEFVGDNSGTVYHTKSVSSLDVNPINISGVFTIPANELDSTDTSIIARVKTSRDSWGASFTYDCTVSSLLFG